MTVPGVADACLAGGARFLQIRAKQLASAPFLRACEQVMSAARPLGASVIVNDRADIARLSNAHGVHLGQDDLQPADARRILGGVAVIGLSTHSLEQARAAAREPIDYLAIGPVFGTASKDTGYTAVGTRMVAEIRRMLDDMGLATPIVAIGGITLERAPDVIGAGAASVAVISDLLATRDPETRTRAYLQALGDAC